MGRLSKKKKKVNKCESLPIVSFQTFNTNYNFETVIDNLSTHQKYMEKMILSIKKGSCLEDLANRFTGKLSQSRWITTTNRILRFFVADPASNMKILMEFVVKVYARVWFVIKCKPSFKESAIHLWQIIYFPLYMP